MSASKRKSKEAQKGADSDASEDLNFSDEEGGLRVDGIYIPPPPEPYCSTENKGPRLMITKITNNFFKSYAQTTIVGPFHKCFNAVVGPNGSGKSNVIDSMLFVFGYRASKIRSKKISVLLHNSEKYRDVQSCSVSVHFTEIIDKEGDDYEIVPGTEFVVSRTAHKDNSSYYTLNGKRVQFKEVATVLKKHGIDLDHNRFLILQGEVEQISLMSAKGTDSEPGMLEYLEDIIGTSRYKMPLVQLSDRVEQLSEVRSEKLNRLKLVQNELNELKEPMEEAVGFLQLENNIAMQKNFLFQKNIIDIEENLKKSGLKLGETEAIVKEFKEKIAATASEKSVKATKLSESANKYEAFEKRKDSLRVAFDSANTKDIELQTLMTQINNNRKKLKERIVEEKKKLEAYERLPVESEKNIKECEQKETEMITKKQKLEEDKINLMATLGNQTKDLQERKATIQTQLVSLNKIVDETKSAYTLAESKLKIFLSNSETENNKLEQLRRNYESSKSTIAQNTSEIEKLKRKIPESENSLKKANKDLLDIRNEETKIVHDMRKNRGHLEEYRSNMQASRSRGKILDSLMQQKNEGNCPGLFGRLGDLGAIDGKYDIAVSTACGPLDNIVVDSVNTAQWCIEFLKRHNIGRATFIALEKQEHLRKNCNSKINTPENVPRLFDLIKIADDRVKPAFYYALRDTLVAETLDQASRIAYGAQRYRVVSLGGDLIETTGTMSGGGKTVSKGRMGRSVAAVSTVNPKDLEKMEKDLNNMNQRLQEIRTQQTNLESQITMLAPELKQMKNAFERYTIEMNSLVKQEPNLKSQLQAQEAKIKTLVVDQEVVKQLSDVVQQKKLDYENATENTSELQAEVDDLTKEIKAKTQGRVQVLDKSLKETAKTIEKCKAEITRLKVGLKTAERNSKKAVENVASMEQDIVSAETELRRIKAQREEIESDAEELLRRIQEISSQLNGEEDEYSDLKKEVESLTKKENKLKAEKIEIDQKFKVLNEKVDELKAKIHHWRLKITQLKYQEVPGEEPMEFKTYTREELDNRDIHNVETELQAFEEEHKRAKPNLNAITEYNKKRVVYIGRSNELEEVTEKRKKMRGYHDMLHSRRKDEFITGYNIIKMKLKEMYQMITLGGDADFEMLDTFDPFNEGIQFRVRPPKKTWKLITNLSGGEKTLSSLALVFALHYYKPSPLYVMDEIDAALDFKNVSIVGNYIKERTKNAQFIIISLRSNMFELADYLIGIYKTYNITKTIAMNPKFYDVENNQNALNMDDNNAAAERSMVAADGSMEAAHDSMEAANDSMEVVEDSQKTTEMSLEVA